MIWLAVGLLLPFFLACFTAVIVVPVIAHYRPRARHARCLRNIEELERWHAEHDEMGQRIMEFDGWSKSYPKKVDWLNVSPGAVWKVDNHNDVQLYQPTYANLFGDARFSEAPGNQGAV